VPVAGERPEHHAVPRRRHPCGPRCHGLPAPGARLQPANRVAVQDHPATEENIAWARQAFEALRAWMAGRRYVNNLSADDGQMVREIWGISYERLVQIKRRYDPDNVFRLNGNIDPAR
jgi:Berberine and berberine like